MFAPGTATNLKNKEYVKLDFWLVTALRFLINLNENSLVMECFNLIKLHLRSRILEKLQRFHIQRLKFANLQFIDVKLVKFTKQSMIKSIKMLSKLQYAVVPEVPC